jgi:hypothetical protein
MAKFLRIVGWLWVALVALAEIRAAILDMDYLRHLAILAVMGFPGVILVLLPNWIKWLRS